MCTVSGYTTHFTSMSEFVWLNIMCFDIYCTITRSSERTTTDRKKFLYYCLYGWGAPLLFLSVILLFDHTELISYKTVSIIGEKGCFLDVTNSVMFVYYYLPMMISTSASIVLFVKSANHITRTARSDVDRKDFKRYRLYLCLFSLRCAIWIPYFIGWLRTYPRWLQYVMADFDSLSGIIIFFLLVWKQNIKQLLLQRFFKRKITPRNDHTAYSSSQPVHFSSLTNGDQTS
ncbi:G-protein coupled receptor Mth2-like [Anopheles darlingi]|uniref:G-protein coupled receptor Mth2-like n=1 Tax=Anopheles darlingi TaxID=43151 RepID=UPI0021004535|nr:G-protein coupled receptor Mth2-like [Anopheles darlingi]